MDESRTDDNRGLCDLACGFRVDRKQLNQLPPWLFRCAERLMSEAAAGGPNILQPPLPGEGKIILSLAGGCRFLPKPGPVSAKSGHGCVNQMKSICHHDSSVVSW